MNVKSGNTKYKSQTLMCRRMWKNSRKEPKFDFFVRNFLLFIEKYPTYPKILNGLKDIRPGTQHGMSVKSGNTRCKS